MNRKMFSFPVSDFFAFPSSLYVQHDKCLGCVWIGLLPLNLSNNGLPIAGFCFCLSLISSERSKGENMKENSLFCNEFIYQDFMVFWL